MNKDVVKRVFSIDQQTKVEGKLKVGARVTVRYDGAGPNKAIRIIVR